MASFISCKSNAIYGDWVPNGNVFSYTDTIYQAEESFSDMSKSTLLSIEKHFLNENNMDTLLVLYTQYENPKVIEKPIDEDTEIYYMMSSDGKNLIQVNFRGKTIQKYNERGLLIERMFEFNEESYGSEKILIEICV